MKTYRNRTSADYEKKDIQMQFVGDTKFSEFVNEIADTGVAYNEVLEELANNFTIDTDNTFVLNTIGGLLSLPPIEYFSQSGSTQAITQDIYKLLIKGQQLRNTWDGTNKGIIDNLKALFPEYIWDIEDMGNEVITVYMIQGDTKINATVQALFEGGWLTPKPAGVRMVFQTVTQGVFTWDSTETNETWDKGVWL